MNMNKREICEEHNLATVWSLTKEDNDNYLRLRRQVRLRKEHLTPNGLKALVAEMLSPEDVRTPYQKHDICFQCAAYFWAKTNDGGFTIISKPSNPAKDCEDVRFVAKVSGTFRIGEKVQIKIVYTLREEGKIVRLISCDITEGRNITGIISFCDEDMCPSRSET